jgi:hypothetical protein
MSAAKVSRAQRHTRRSPCPICDGYQSLPQGKGVRCAGFTSDDGDWAYCTREEYAGSLGLNYKAKPPAYSHKLRGPCSCGVTHSPALAAPAPKSAPRITRFELRDQSGQLVGVHVRTDRADGSKSFRWEQHHGRGALAMPLYGLAAHLDAPLDALRVICEGEKATDAVNAAVKRAGHTDLIALGTVTGAPACPSDNSLRVLVGHPIALWPDNDAEGRKQMDAIAARLVAIGAPAPRWVSWPDAPAKADAADYFTAGGTVEGLGQLVTESTAEQQDDEQAEPTSPGRAVDPFPLDTLPRDVQAFVRTVADAIHCPLDYVAMPLLVYASAAIGNSACLEIKRGWREYARFWLAIVGDPGDKKSPALAAVHRMIEDLQRAHHATWETERERWRREGSEGSEPPLTQLYTSDATIEALGDLLHDNPRGILVTRDELAGWPAGRWR